LAELEQVNLEQGIRRANKAEVKLFHSFLRSRFTCDHLFTYSAVPNLDRLAKTEQVKIEQE